MRHGPRLIGSALANLIGKVVAVAGGLILPPFVVREIGADGYGAVVVVNSLLQFVALVQLGTPQALQRFVPQEIALERQEALDRFLSTGLALLLGAAAIATAIVLAVLAAPRLVLAAPGGLSTESLRGVVALMGLSAVLAIPLSLGQVALYCTERFGLLNAVLIGGTVARVVLVVALLSWFEGSVLAYAAASALATLLPALVLFAVGRRALPRTRIAPGLVDGATAARIATYGGEVFYNTLVSLFYLQADYLIIGKMLGPAAVTTFSLAVLWSTVSRNVIATGVSVVLPAAAARGALGDEAGLRSLLVRSTKYALLLGLLPVVFLAVFRHEVIAVWLGGGFAGTATLMVPLLLAEILAIGTTGAIEICTGTGRVRPFTVTNTLCAVAHLVAVAWLLGPGDFGVEAAAWAYCAVFALRSGLALPLLAARSLRLSPARLYRESYLRPLLVAAAALLVALGVRSAFEIGGWWSLSVAAFVVGLAYVPIVLALALDAYDRATLASFRAAVSSRLRPR